MPKRAADEQLVAPTDKNARFGRGGLRKDMSVALTGVREYVQTRMQPGELQYNIRRVAQIPHTLRQKHPDLFRLLTQAAMVDPLPKYDFNGKRKNPPWPIHFYDSIGLCLPRAFAIEALGPPASPDSVVVWNGEPLSGSDGAGLTPLIPLFGDKDCVDNNRVNQQALMQTVTDVLEKQISDHKFGGAVFCIPPSMGKTGTAMHIIAHLNRKALFIVPNLNLIPQVKKEVLKFFGPTARAGHLRTSDEKNWKIDDCDIVVASLASVLKCNYDLSPYGTIFIDEVHKTSAEEMWRLYTKFANRNVIGITATPEKTDETGGVLEWTIGPIVWFSPLELEKTRWGGLHICKQNLVYAPDVALQLEYCRRGRETLLDVEKMYTQLATHPGRNDWLTNFIADKARQGRQILCLGQRVALMKTLAANLEAQNVDVGLLLGESNRPERPRLNKKGEPLIGKDGQPKMTRKMTEEEMDEVRGKQVRIFTDCIGYQALNVPELDMMVILDPACKGIDAWIQRIGRLTRDYDKPVPEIHFVVDHGVPSFERRAKDAVHALLQFSSSFKVFEHTVQIR